MGNLCITNIQHKCKGAFSCVYFTRFAGVSGLQAAWILGFAQQHALAARHMANLAAMPVFLRQLLDYPTGSNLPPHCGRFKR
jgi:hypothetical protein